MRIPTARLLIVVGALVASLLLGAGPASAATVKVRPSSAALSCPVALPNYCSWPTKGNDAVLKVHLDARYSDITMMCFTFRFAGDVMDPGEGFFLPGFGGWDNLTTSSVAERTLCSTASPEFLAGFRNGTGSAELFVTSGSAVLESATVQVFGTAR